MASNIPAQGCNRQDVSGCGLNWVNFAHLGLNEIVFNLVFRPISSLCDKSHFYVTFCNIPLTGCHSDENQLAEKAGE
jgi:hypothetical protein